MSEPTTAEDRLPGDVAQSRLWWMRRWEQAAEENRALKAERDALQERLEKAEGIIDPAMWVVKNFEEWRDSPTDGDAFATLMAAICELATFLEEKP